LRLQKAAEELARLLVSLSALGQPLELDHLVWGDLQRNRPLEVLQVVGVG
jgi:hypothetical protein